MHYPCLRDTPELKLYHRARTRLKVHQRNGISCRGISALLMQLRPCHLDVIVHKLGRRYRMYMLDGTSYIYGKQVQLLLYRSFNQNTG